MPSPSLLAHDDRCHVTCPRATFVFLHAFPLDRRMWRQQVEDVVEAGGRALAVDIRGFGQSPLEPAASSVDDHAYDIAALLETKGIDKAILVGLSLGGYIALSFADRYSHRLAGLLLADTKATKDDDAAREGRAAKIHRVQHEGVAAVFESMIPELVARSTSHEILEGLRSLAAAQPVAGVVAALRAMRDRVDRTTSLASIRVPTRVVVGAEDTPTFVREAKAMAHAIAGAKLTILEHAGHFSNLERPDAFKTPLLELCNS